MRLFVALLTAFNLALIVVAGPGMAQQAPTTWKVSMGASSYLSSASIRCRSDSICLGHHPNTLKHVSECLN